MNPENPSRAELELRLTMLLLGELPADEAAQLRAMIAQDAGLKKLHDELQSTIVLVREAKKNPAETAGEDSAPLKLSDERRQKLLAHFKTPRPQESFWIRPLKIPMLVPALVTVSIIGLLVALLLPSLAAAKKRAHTFGAVSERARVTESDEIVNAPAAMPAAPAPTSVTFAPAPVLAPPATQIVLPQTETPAPATVNGSLADSSKGGVYSQKIVGYVDQNIFGAAAVSVGSFPSQPPAGGQIATLGDNVTTGSANSSFAADKRLGAGGLAGGGFGGAGGFSGVSPSTGTDLALNNSSAGVSRDQSVEAIQLKPGEAQSYDRIVSTVAPPAEQFATRAINGEAGTTFALRKPAAGIASQAFDDGIQPPQASPPPVESPARLGIPPGALATANREGALERHQLYREVLNGKKDINASAAPTVMPPPGSAGEMEKAGRSELVFDKNLAEFKAAPADAAQTGGMATDSFQTGLTKEDVSGLRYVTASGVNSAPVPTETDHLAQADRKRELQDLEETHKMLGLKIAANNIDAKIPAGSMVQITEPAQPNTKRTFWQSLKGEYASTAKIKVENDGGVIAGFNSSAATAQDYDPYFIQTTFEIIQSRLVLGKVVDDLHLDTAWAKQNGGQRLTKDEAIERLKSQLELQPVKNTKLVAISVSSENPNEAANLANAVARAYQSYRIENNQQTAAKGLEVLREQYTNEERMIQGLRLQVASAEPAPANDAELAVKEAVLAQKLTLNEDKPLRRPPADAPVPQPEILTRENAFSTFSLNVSDVSFKLAQASLEKGLMPDAAGIRSEEFINAFDYRDPEAAAGRPLAFAAERARYPFAQNRELLRFSIKTAAAGRPAGRALNIVLLLDNSGSMERADRVAIIREALRVLAGQLEPQDTVSVVTFARTARLWADGVAGDKAGETLAKVGDITPEGGTNLEEAMRLAYETARRHYLANGMNRVVLLTDGAANLGNVDPAVLKEKVEAQRKQGIALDCFGIGFDGYDDDLLEELSRHGDGRYAFINSPDEAGQEFAAKLAGALQIAAADVKVQVEFNPDRVISYRQIGYAKHQLTKEQFRDNSVDAAVIAAQEAGNALYTVETKPDGSGPVATVRVRYRIPGTQDFHEHSWDVAYEKNVPALDQASAAMRLAGTAGAFSEWLAASPFAQEVTPDGLLKILNGVPQVYGADERPKKLEWMIRQAKSLSGK